ANRDAPGAVAAMSGTAFAAGRPVASDPVAVNRETFANARVMARPAATPTSDSLVGGRGRAAAPPASAVNRAVVAANRPAPSRPSFAQRQATLQRNGGQPLSTRELRTLAAQPGNAGAAVPANNVRVVGNRGTAAAARAAAQANTAPNRAAASGAASNGQSVRS